MTLKLLLSQPSGSRWKVGNMQVFGSVVVVELSGFGGFGVVWCGLRGGCRWVTRCGFVVLRWEKVRVTQYSIVWVRRYRL